MASKTIRGVLQGYDGVTACTALVFAENGATILNGSGDTVTFSSYGVFTFTLTENVTGFCDVLIIKTSDSSILSNRGKLFIPADIAGTYDIDSFYKLNQAAFDNQVYPPVERSATDTKAIQFFYMYPSATLTGTKQIDGGSSSAISGAITYVGAVGTKYMYQLAYNANDRPSGEGTVLYSITDGVNDPRYLTLQVAGVGNNVTIVPLSGVVEQRSDETDINVFTGETPTISIACVDSQGAAVTLTGLTLGVYFDQMDGTNVATVASGDIVISGSTFTFTMPSAVTANACKKKWSLRKSTGNAVLMHGTVIITDAADD